MHQYLQSCSISESGMISYFQSWVYWVMYSGLKSMIIANYLPFHCCGNTSSSLFSLNWGYLLLKMGNVCFLFFLISLFWVFCFLIFEFYQRVNDSCIDHRMGAYAVECSYFLCCLWMVFRVFELCLNSQLYSDCEWQWIVCKLIQSSIWSQELL